MRAQRVQVMVRVTGHTFKVPLGARSGRPGNSLRSDSPGRFSCAAPQRHWKPFQDLPSGSKPRRGKVDNRRNTY